MQKSLIQFAILLVSLVLSQTAFADIKIKTRQTTSGQTYEVTTYIKGKRQRVEMKDNPTVSVTQCDLRRDVRLVPSSKTFMIDPFGDVVTQEKPSVTQTKTTKTTEDGGTVTMIYTTKDTGERKQIFGYTARHLIITMEKESSPDACEKNKDKTQIDGWYIDAEWAFQCDRSAEFANYRSQATGCRDKYVVKEVGSAKRGYPLYERMTMFDESGKETYSFINEVVELSKATLDSALFEVPADYREAKSSQDLYASMAPQSDDDDARTNSTTYGKNNQSTNNSGLNATLKNVSTPPQIEPPTELGAKQEGVIRIALAGVKTGSVGEGVNAAELAAAIQNSLAQHLKSPKIEVVQLEAKLPSAIDAEVKEKECDYVIYANVSHKKGGGGFGMFKKIAPVLSSVVPMAGMGGNVAGAVAAQTVYTAATMSQSVKSKDEISLEVKMNAPGSPAAALTKQVKAKAKSDGEDIISPLLQQIALAIVDTATAKS